MKVGGQAQGRDRLVTWRLLATRPGLRIEIAHAFGPVRTDEDGTEYQSCITAIKRLDLPEVSRPELRRLGRQLAVYLARCPAPEPEG